jgi:hypothetical protein
VRHWHRHVGVRRAVVGRVAPPFREFVRDERRVEVLIVGCRRGISAAGPARGEHADEVALAHRPFGQFLVLAGGGAEEVAEDHCFEFGAKLNLRRRGVQYLSHGLVLTRG